MRLPSALLFAVLVGCASGPPPAPEAICRMERSHGAGPDVPPEAFLQLLLHGYEATNGLVVGPLLDCTGTPIGWQEVDDNCATRSDTPLPPSRLTSNSVVLANLDANTRLVWVQLQRFPNGDALGPVARVQIRGDSLAVLAIGSARSGPEQARLKLERLNDVDLAVLEGDRCDAGTCQRFARLIPQRGRRFIPEPLRFPDGGCAGPAAFGVKRQMAQTQSPTLQRIFELESTLAFAPTQLTVHEQLFVRDRDPRQPAASARLYRSAQDDRSVTATQTRLVVDKPSLWARLPEFSAGR